MNKLIYGLTGMSGAGKTTVSKAFSDNGIYVINCDTVAREVTEKGKPCLSYLADVFGDILNNDGTLNRKVLGNIVFNDKAKLIRLNEIIYPYITYDVIKRIEKADNSIILLDAPTLFESGIDYICDGIISVVCDKTLSVKRIMERDNIDEDAALARLQSQHDKSYYTEKSDYVIDNNGDITTLIEKAENIAAKIRNKQERN